MKLGGLGAAESFGIIDHSETARHPARPQGLRELQKSPQNPVCAGASRRVSGPGGDDGAGKREEEVRRSNDAIREYFSRQKSRKFFCRIDWTWAGREMLADGAAMLVMNYAGGMIEHLPAALPGEKSEVRVFEIERSEERIETAEFEEFSAIKRARSAAAIEAGEQESRLPGLRYGPPTARHPATSHGSSRFLHGACGVAEEDLAGNGENLIVYTPVSSVKPARSGARKSGSTRISLFRSTTMSFFAARNPALEPPPKPRFVGQRDDADMRDSFREANPRCRRSSRYRPR